MNRLIMPIIRHGVSKNHFMYVYTSLRGDDSLFISTLCTYIRAYVEMNRLSDCVHYRTVSYCIEYENRKSNTASKIENCI